MNEDQYKAIMSRLDSIDKRQDQSEDGISRIDRDLTNDRKDVGEINVRLGTIEGRLQDITTTLTRSQVKTKDALQDAVEAGMQPVKKQLDSFVDKKVNIKHIYHFSLKTWWNEIIKGVK